MLEIAYADTYPSFREKEAVLKKIGFNSFDDLYNIPRIIDKRIQVM
jgi:glycine cleavage system pyridoxal-binding protein P